MAELLSPGVYVLEESAGEKPIAGVSTSTGAFVGIAEKGPVNEAVFIANFTQYTNVFGGFDGPGILPLAVYQFFKEGGARCYVTRVAGTQAAMAKASIPSGANTAIIQATSPGSWANGLTIVVEDGKTTDTFRIRVRKVSAAGSYKDLEVFDNLTVETMDDIINSTSVYIRFTFGNAEARPDNTTGIPLADGSDDLAAVTNTTFCGDAAAKSGLYSFDVIDDINLVAIPDAADLAAKRNNPALLKDVTLAGLAYCKNRGDCFFIADAPRGVTPQGMKDYKLGTTDTSPVSSDYGAIYYPWLYMNHPVSGKKLLLPPAGAIAGIYADTDIKIGVHKAPAGLATGKIKSASGIERKVIKGEQDILNPLGINVLRFFDTSGIIVWGARTATNDQEWRYINVRRLFLMVEESIDEGTGWVVFEPNSPALWGRINRSITAFLTSVWQGGALFGTTPEEAFYVKVDAENNPESERAAGRLNIEVGIAPVKPAEFVIIRISQKVAVA